MVDESTSSDESSRFGGVKLRIELKNGAEVDVTTKGRHDPCVGIRAVPVGEAMMACVLADHILRFDAQCGT